MKDLGHGPQSRDEFEARLRAIGAERYHDRHPFHARLHGGDCTPDEVRGNQDVIDAYLGVAHD